MRRFYNGGGGKKEGADGGWLGRGAAAEVEEGSGKRRKIRRRWIEMGVEGGAGENVREISVLTQNFQFMVNI